jgi:hypothetical protein
VADPTVVTLIPFRKVISPSSPPSFIEMSKEISMKKSSRMSIVHPHAAGVDIGAEFHVVAVPPDADAEPVRTFQVSPATFIGCPIGSKPVTLRPSPWSPQAFTGCLLLRSLKLRVSM